MTLSRSGLGHVAVHGHGGESAAFELLRELRRSGLRPAEDEHGLGRLFELQDLRQHLELLPLGDVEETLLDEPACSRRMLDLDPLRIAQVALGDAQDFVGHGRGEERDLPLGRCGAEDALDFFDEAHLQHLVRFIEDDHS